MKSKTQVYIFLSFLGIISLINGITDPWGSSIGFIGRYARWAFDYSHGFTKRGLVGEAVSLVNPHLSIANVQVAYFSALVVLLFLLPLYYLYFIDNSNQEDTILFALWGITCTGTIQQYAYDVARFDIFGALIIILSVVAVKFLKSDKLKICLVILASFLSVMIHEAYFLWVFPSLLFVYFFDKTKFSYSKLILISVPVFVFTLYVGTSSPNDFGSATGLASSLSNTTSFEVSVRRTQPLYRSLYESIKYNIDALNPPINLFNFILASFCFSFVLYPCLYSLYNLYSYLDNNYVYIYSIFVISIICPLFLYGLGFDHGRWWAMSMTSFSILYITIIRGPHEEYIRETTFPKRYFIAVGIIMNVFLGPAGVTSLFPKSYTYRFIETILF